MNWSQIPMRSINKQTFWAKTREVELENSDLFKQINSQFAQKQVKGNFRFFTSWQLCFPLLVIKPLLLLLRWVISSLASPPESAAAIALPKKKVKELKVIDPKMSQNLGILLNANLKNYTFEEIRISVLKCDDSESSLSE